MGEVLGANLPPFPPTSPFALEVGPLHSSPPLPFPPDVPPLPSEVGPLNPATESGECCRPLSSHCRVLGEAPDNIKFGAF